MRRFRFQVGVGGALNVEVAAADIGDSLVVDEELGVGVLEEGMRAQNGVVGLNDGGGNLGGREDGEAELGLLAVVDGEALKEEGAETGAGTATSGVKDDEAMEVAAAASEFAYAVESKVNDFLADGVAATSAYVGGVLLPEISCSGWKRWR